MTLVSSQNGRETMSGLDERPFPRGALIGAFCLIGLTIIGVGVHQLIKFRSPVVATASAGDVLASRNLRFIDQGGGATAFGGAVAVYDVTTGAYLSNLQSSDGFIRAVLNSLLFERTKRKLEGDTVFTLILGAGERLALVDPLTGRSVNLGAFGPDNRQVFVKFLPQAGLGS